MSDPIAFAIGFGLIGSVAAGPAMAYFLQRLPLQWRRKAEWLLIAGALGVAVVAALLPQAQQGMAFWYVVSALPGFIAFLASRTLLASAIVSLLPLYFVIGALTRGWPTYTPALALDQLLGVQPEWMLVYGSLYVFVVLLPMLVVRERDLARRSMRAYLMVMLVSYAGFLIYPTMAPRPADVPGPGFSAWSLRLLYSIDAPHGCFPSLHVAYSFVSALTCYRVHRSVGIIAALWAAIIGVSTLFTKQHYAVDVIAGALEAYVAYALFLRTYPREAVSEDDRRRAPVRAMGVIGIFALMVAGYWVAYKFDTVSP